MVKVKLLVSRSGSDGAYSPGDLVEVSADEAARMCEAGQAEILRTKKTERATKKNKVERTSV